MKHESGQKLEKGDSPRHFDSERLRNELETTVSEKPLSVENTKESVSAFIKKWERVFFDASRKFAEEDAFLGDELSEVDNLPLRLCERMREAYGQKAVETFFDATCDLFSEHSVAIETIWNEGELFQAVGLDFFIDRMVELAIARDHRAIPYLTEALLETFYISHESESYRDTIKRHLNIDDPNMWPRATVFLDVLRSILIEALDNQDAQATIIMGALRDIDAKRGGNYILRLRIKQLLGLGETPLTADDAHTEEDDPLPFIVGNKVFGFHFENKFYISDKNDFARLHALVDKTKQEVSSLRDQSPDEGHGRYTNEGKLLARAMLDIWPLLKEISLDDVALYDKEKDQAHRTEDLIDYKYLLIKPIREHLKNDLGIDITTFSVPEQFYLLSFLKTVSLEDIENVRAFAQTYGTDGLRTFLSLEHDRGFGSSIIALGEKLPQESARALFKKYGELVDAARDAEEYVTKTFGKSGAKETVSEITKDLLTKSTNMLKRAADELANGDGPTKDIAGVARSIEETLANTRAETLLFTSTFKSLILHGERLSLREIREISFERVAPSNISQSDRKQMREIYALNYADTPELQHELLDGFDVLMGAGAPDRTSSIPHFYIMKRADDIVAFCLYNENPQTSKAQFAMMNVNPRYQKSMIGQTFLDETLSIETPWNRIEADCAVFGPMSAHYIESGFVGTSFYQFHEVNAMKIEFKIAPGKKIAKETIIANATSTSSAIDTNKETLVFVATTPHEIPFHLMNEGKILSRYFKQGANYYAVFEDRPLEGEGHDYFIA